jgi:carboxylesterase type B
MLLNSGISFLNMINRSPLCPQPLDSIEFEFLLFQSRLDYSYLYNDELQSCHLTLALPHEPPISPEGYPVMVWFNGGGFMIGSAAWPQYNPTKMAALANEKGTPTIIISVNYRVGIFGSMASKDLLEEAKSNGQEGVGNQGLRDQQTALKWVQKFIKGFGGDPSKVTIFGESAGSASVNAHMVSKTSEKLFSRAIMESGSITMVSAFPVEVQDNFYQNVLKLLNVIGETGKERLEALRKVPLEEIFKAIPPSHPHRPTMDGYFLDWVPSFADIEEKNPKLFPEWMDAVMFGCTKDDVSPTSPNLTKGFHFRNNFERKSNGNNHRSNS